jgi:hypothetical protein
MELKAPVFSLLLACGVLLFAEVASWIAFVIVDHRAPSYQRFQQERSALLAGEGLRPAPEELQAGPSPVAAFRSPVWEVIHPFLGFVLDPAINQTEHRREHGEIEISDLGFYQPPGPPTPRTGDELRIGVFGGSAAFLFAFNSRQHLVDEISRRVDTKGRRVVVDCFALGGYKQPQQLLTLAYLRALGEHFDVVVNLDGFNEVALTVAENLPAGVHPSYPRGWERRVAGLPEPEAQALAAAIVQSREEREARAARFSRPLLRYSLTANLVWRAGDRAVQRRTAGLERRLETLRTAKSATGFKALGPPYRASGLPPRDRLQTGNDRGPLYREIARIWKESSLQMHQLCEADGSLYLHLLQPNQYVPDSKPMGREERRVALQEDSPYRTPVVEGYPLLVEAGEELRRRGVRFHDVSRLFKDHPEPLYMDTCCHFNRKGNEILADEVVKLIAGGRDLT